MRLTNPNNWPIHATLSNFAIDIWSLDNEADDATGEAIYMGRNTLADPVKIATSTEVVFDVANALTVTPDVILGEDFRTRFARDCTADGAAKETKLRLRLTELAGDVYGIDLDLGTQEVTLEPV